MDRILAEIKKTGQTAIRTADMMALLNVRKDHASQILSRLSETGHVSRLKRGLWLLSGNYEPFLIAEYLTAPFPCYISLQSALYHHGMISQIPVCTYCVSPARTRLYNTLAGPFSIHHVSESFFYGYDETGTHGIKIARPEKALIDLFYLSNTSTRIFSALPELELPSGFSIKKAREMIARIRSSQRRSMVGRKLKELTI
jgi:predicted transcriptional regulator of viral defense system